VGGEGKVKSRIGARFLSILALGWLGCLFTPTVGFALPEGRHYEMVSPLYKGGYRVNQIEAIAMQGGAEGDRVAFASLGTFAGAQNKEFFNTYLARRGTAGWSTESFLLPAAIAPYASLADVPPTLDTSLFAGKPGSNNGVAVEEGIESDLFLHRLDIKDADFEMAGMPLIRLDGKALSRIRTLGASPDFCHIIFSLDLANVDVFSEALLPEAQGTHSILYELATGAPGCGEERALRLVAVNNKLGVHGEPETLDPHCVPFLGSVASGESNKLNAVAASGREVFFTSNANLVKPECDENGEFIKPNDPAILYMRINGEHTVEISRPATNCAPCQLAPQASAVFDGANEAGTRVFFTTKQPLAASDTDTGTDAYMANIGCPSPVECQPAEREVTSLLQISHDSNGQAAEVQGVSAVAPNGLRVYFVAHGVLINGDNAEGLSPSAGADNLYVYDAEDGLTQFISDLCSGSGTSGETQDSHCSSAPGTSDVGVWSGPVHQEQIAGQDGRFFVFSSYARLVAGDTDTTSDVYRYDAATGQLDRVSLGENGFDANGNSNVGAEIAPFAQGGRLAETYEVNYRAISEDGSRIVFEAAEPLSPNAVNGLLNAYEWHKEPGWSKGQVSLISSGSDEESVGERETVAITPSGRDIFFVTTQGLLSQDTDGAKDLYAARLGEDFPPSSAQRQLCSGDGCQGPLTNPAPLLVPGSVSQTSGENLATSKKTTPKKKKPALKNKSKKKKRKTKRGKSSVRTQKNKKSVGRGGR
jgi:hypothetical protein